MKLLIVTHYYADHRGGVEIVAGELAARFAARGVEVVWAASGPAPAQPIPSVTALPMTAWNGVERWTGLPCPIWSPGSHRQLRAAVRQADLVQLHDTLYLGNLFAGWQADRVGRPLLITQHVGELSFRSRFLTGLIAFANRWVAARRLRSADQTVFISDAVRCYFEGLTPFSAPPCLIPNGVDLARFQPVTEDQRANLRVSLGWNSPRPQLLFVGRFVPKKGLVILAELAQRFPECDWHFAGWGPIDPRSWQLPNVHCHGSVERERLPDFYRAADLLVLPSTGEGFPLVVQEAMACGTPALVTPCSAHALPGVAEQVWCAPADVEAMTEQLQSLLAHPSTLSARREQVARFARSAWDWDHCADEYLQRFQQLLETKNDHPIPPVVRDSRSLQSPSVTDSAQHAVSSMVAAPLQPTTTWRRWSSTAIGLLLFAVLLWWQRAAFHSIDWATVRPGPLGASGLCLLGGLLAMSGRTWLLARSVAPQATFPDVVRITFYGMLSSYTFLGMYGGLGILSWYLIRRCGIAPWLAGTLVASDRLIGFATMMLLGAAAAIWRPQAGSWLFSLQGLTVVVISGIVTVLLLGFRRFPGKTSPSQNSSAHPATSMSWALWIPLILTSFAAHIGSISSLWWISQSLPLKIDPPSWLDHTVMFPQLELASFLIPTPAGLGVREGMLCLLYRAVSGQHDSAANQAGLIVACGYRVVTLVITLVGSLLFCWWNPAPRQTFATATG